MFSLLNLSTAPIPYSHHNTFVSDFRHSRLYSSINLDSGKWSSLLESLWSWARSRFGSLVKFCRCLHRCRHCVLSGKISHARSNQALREKVSRCQSHRSGNQTQGLSYLSVIANVSSHSIQRPQLHRRYHGRQVAGIYLCSVSFRYSSCGTMLGRN